MWLRGNFHDSRKRFTACVCTRHVFVILITVSITLLTTSMFMFDVPQYFSSQIRYMKYTSTPINQSKIRIDFPSSSESPKYTSEGNVEGTLKQRDVHDSHNDFGKRLSLVEIKSPKYKQHDVDMLSKYTTIFKESRVNCAAIIQGNKTEIERGIRIANETRNQLLSDEYYIKSAKNCDEFKGTRGYITSVLSKQEEEFPIAYSILAYKDIEMVDRLLRQIYRPQNFYCIHIDNKTDESSFLAASAIADCFPNVFMASSRIDVKWGQFSVLKPELVCMKDLYSKGKWKYFINLTGQEMPLKTNLELVKILTAYQGANDISGSFRGVDTARLKPNKMGPPPANIHSLKGSVHIVANRDFIDYILHNKTAAEFLKWVKGTYIPDETYFTTLNHNPHLGIPGTYPRWPEADRSNRKPFLARFKQWSRAKTGLKCHGYWSRHICILSTGDLPVLAKRPELFANKFHFSNDSVVVGCLEEKLFNSTRDGFLGLKQFNTTLYEGLGFVINQVGRNITKKFIEIPNVIDQFTQANL